MQNDLLRWSDTLPVVLTLHQITKSEKMLPPPFFSCGGKTITAVYCGHSTMWLPFAVRTLLDLAEFEPAVACWAVGLLVVA